MKTLIYESKVESRATQHNLIFDAAEHIRNQPDNVASTTRSLIMRAENCLATVIFWTITVKQVLYLSTVM